MSYKKASDILPEDLINIIQHYVDGEYILYQEKNVIESHEEIKQIVKRK